MNGLHGRIDELEKRIARLAADLALAHGMVGWVTSTDGDGYGVNVALEGSAFGGMPALPAQVGTPGPRDGVRGTFPPLPTRGTRVLVAFPRGDIRNATVVCSLPGALPDANALSSAIAHANYRAEWSGFWHWHDETGNTADVWPDGSAILVGFTGIPTLTRHSLDRNQVRIQTPYTQQQRVTAATSGTPFPWTWKHSTAATVTVDVSGAVAIAAAPGHDIVLSVAGATVTVAHGGTVTVSGTSLAIPGGLLAVTGQITVNGTVVTVP